MKKIPKKKRKFTELYFNEYGSTAEDPSVWFQRHMTYAS